MGHYDNIRESILEDEAKQRKKLLTDELDSLVYDMYNDQLSLLVDLAKEIDSVETIIKLINKHN